VKYNGSTWTVTNVVSQTNAPAGVSCASSTFCMAVDSKGNALKYNGSTWTVTNVDSTRALKAISCPATSFCAAVDGSGYALSYNGTSWTTPANINGSRAFRAISCLSSTTCQAVDASGNVLSYGASGWGPVQNIDAARSLAGISCPSTTFCAAVDGSGYGLTYSAPTSTSQFSWGALGDLPVILSDGTNHYIYGPSGTPVEQVRLGTSIPTYMTYVPSSSAWLTTDAAGNQTGFWRYDAFGTPAYGIPTSPFGFAGEYSDTTTGFSNLRARWYEPQSGGFTTRDPLFSDTGDAYVYANDDPVNATDPTG
jgi:RHS repeat-associated protein